jgi:hypothetical protein
VLETHPFRARFESVPRMEAEMATPGRWSRTNSLSPPMDPCCRRTASRFCC